MNRGDYFVFTDTDKLPTVKRRQWETWDFGYDNVAAAMLTLFAVQTGEGWPAWVYEMFRWRIDLSYCNLFYVIRCKTLFAIFTILAEFCQISLEAKCILMNDGFTYINRQVVLPVFSYLYRIRAVINLNYIKGVNCILPITLYMYSFVPLWQQCKWTNTDDTWGFVLGGFDRAVSIRGSQSERFCRCTVTINNVGDVLQ